VGEEHHRQGLLLSAVPSSNYFTQLYFTEPRTFGINLDVKFEVLVE
jgi:hypothetical protein